MLSKQVEGHEESYKHENNMVISEDIKKSHCSHDTLHSLIIKEDVKQQISEQHEESEQQEEVINEHCEDFMNQPLFDEYPEEEVCISPSLEIYSNDPIYDSYESESDEDHKDNDSQPILIAKELLPFPSIDVQENIPHDFQEVSFDFHSDEVSTFLHDIGIEDDEQVHDQNIVESEKFCSILQFPRLKQYGVSLLINLLIQ